MLLSICVNAVMFRKAFTRHAPHTTRIHRNIHFENCFLTQWVIRINAVSRKRFWSYSCVFGGITYTALVLQLPESGEKRTQVYLIENIPASYGTSQKNHCGSFPRSLIAVHI